MSDPGQSVTFADRAEGLLARLEAAIDRLADDFDIDVLRAGNVVTLTFENGHRIVVNTQEAAQEIWVAARAGGYHFRWNEDVERWNDTRSAEDLRLVLARLIGLETGATPTLNL
jgi:CyaY protein